MGKDQRLTFVQCVREQLTEQLADVQTLSATALHLLQNKLKVCIPDMFFKKIVCKLQRWVTFDSQYADLFTSAAVYYLSLSWNGQKVIFSLKCTKYFSFLKRGEDPRTFSRKKYSQEGWLSCYMWVALILSHIVFFLNKLLLELAIFLIL